MEILTTPGSIDRRNTMYPSTLDFVINNQKTTEAYSTTYGFVLEGKAIYENNVVEGNSWFSIGSADPVNIFITGTTVLITRLGFIGQNTVGGPIEPMGRLTYIDGCSDTMLVYPPRMGDASLNALYFPENIDQTFHVHPSLRMGIIAKGNGFCNLKDKEIPLTVGSVFCLDPMELHRFRTEESQMVVIAFHPDGDWGPTDHNHTMINRTYIHNSGV